MIVVCFCCFFSSFFLFCFKIKILKFQRIYNKELSKDVRQLCSPCVRGDKTVVESKFVVTTAVEASCITVDFSCAEVQYVTIVCKTGEVLVDTSKWQKKTIISEPGFCIDYCKRHMSVCAAILINPTFNYIDSKTLMHCFISLSFMSYAK